jgi:hypothetical protein|eukprot:COSAG02_NODE_2395_length_8958_cov_167.540354_5_plen_68_part_00
MGTRIHQAGSSQVAQGYSVAHIGDVAQIPYPDMAPALHCAALLRERQQFVRDSHPYVKPRMKLCEVI